MKNDIGAAWRVLCRARTEQLYWRARYTTAWQSIVTEILVHHLLPKDLGEAFLEGWYEGQEMVLRGWHRSALRIGGFFAPERALLAMPSKVESAVSHAEEVPSYVN
jgi:hypothetical protein